MRTRYLLFCALLIAVATAATVYFWPQLPARVPVHWNAGGVVDGYGPKAALWLLGPGMMAMVAWLGMVMPAISPRRFEIGDFEPTYYYVSGVVVGLLAYVYALVLAASLHVQVPMGTAIPAGMFVLLILAGNPMGKVRRNFFMGIRTPWTLASERVWYATHRLAARLMVASGVLGLFALWLGAPIWVLLALMLAWAPLAVGYSLLLYKRLPR
ncbi:SdpI family protein [Duganella sp. S19_KUP01_CR8]|uniref:SdpI family protein n=1 Tax=Duganella sp. S19_KUP01_CR8 TaxID=3025502 RepID=UPI002FCD9C3F